MLQGSGMDQRSCYDVLLFVGSHKEERVGYVCTYLHTKIVLDTPKKGFGAPYLALLDKKSVEQ
jgi:hypothetical protein